jgi:iron complex outermembrane receptor protein
MRRGQGRKPSFLKKRSKKLLDLGLSLSRKAETKCPKVFWFFFSKKNCFLAFFLVVFSSAQAQSVDYGSLEQMFGEPITTSATGKPQRASDVPADMVIITQDDIRRSGADNIPDILQFVTGIDVRTYSFGDTQVGVNGYDTPLNPRLLVLVDGRQVYIDTLGYEAWNTIPVQLSEIRQIEIVKGPNSALFGFNAVSGVINIITFDPLLDNVNSATVRGGNLGYGQGEAVVTQHIGTTAGIRLSLGGYTANGYREPLSPYAPPPREASFNIDGRWQATSNILLRASGGVTDANTDRAVVDLPENNFQNHLSDWRIGATAQTAAGILDLDAYDDFGSDNSRLSPVGTRLELNTQVDRISDVVKLGADHTVRLGLEYRDAAMTSAVRVGGTVSYTNLAVNAMWDWQISPMFDLTNAVRLDHMSLHFQGSALIVTPDRTVADYNRTNLTEPSFNSGLVVHLTPEDTVRLTLARGLQLPSLFDFGFQFQRGVQLLTGVPDAAPSAVWHAELGYTKILPEIAASLDAALFFERNTKMIVDPGVTNFVFVNGNLVTETVNGGSSNEIGVQAGLHGTLGEHLRWNVSYRYITISEDFKSTLPSNPYTRYDDGTPHNAVIAGIGYTQGPWEANLQGRWQSSYTDTTVAGIEPVPTLIGAYATFNARVGYKITKYLTVAATAETLNTARLLEAAGDHVDRRFIGSLTLRY